MKTIDTLIPDIKELITKGIEEGDYKDFGNHASKVLQRGLRVDDGDRAAGVWFSNVGGPCVRKLWYKLHNGDKAEPLHPNTRFKFLFGDILEGLLLDLAVKSGHRVEYAQERLEYNEVRGRIDAVIDGVLVDIKTASPFSFKKFKDGLKPEDDAFGYLTQLGGYLAAANEKGICESRNEAAFLVINKVTGALHLDRHTFTEDDLSRFRTLICTNRDIAQGLETPERAFSPEPDGRSGNLKLGVNCSYCEFKGHCWPGLRTFLYSRGPVFLTNVERVPDVPEINIEDIEND